jgi:hypothetical protein
VSLAQPSHSHEWIPFERCPFPPWEHQREGVARLVSDPRGVLLADKVGYGKTLQVVAAACHLYEHRQIDSILTICPSYARSVWVSPNPLLGDFAKHAWETVPYELHEFFVGNTRLPAPGPALHVVATNFELARRPDRLQALLAWMRGRAVWLVIDEGWMVKNPMALQTKALGSLSAKAARVSVLNGTPGEPHEIYSQITLINPSAYPVKNWWHWKARYCQMGGFQAKAIVGYRADTTPERVSIERRYILRRDADNLIDIPERLPTQTIEARLDHATWKVYTAMRDEFVAWLSANEAAVASQAGAKAMRLAQILAGFVGGVEAHDADGTERAPTGAPITEREVGREKLEALLFYLDSVSTSKLILWCRFRPEMKRLAETLRARGERVYMLWGQQPPAERDEVKRVFAPGSPDTGRAILVGHRGAGGASLNFSAADLMVHVTHEHSLIRLTQAEGRVVRPGQQSRVRTVDIIAVGPQGQKTFDHAVLAALRRKEEITTWTRDQWTAALQ